MYIRSWESSGWVIRLHVDSPTFGTRGHERVIFVCRSGKADGPQGHYPYWNAADMDPAAGSSVPCGAGSGTAPQEAVAARMAIDMGAPAAKELGRRG